MQSGRPGVSLSGSPITVFTGNRIKHLKARRRLFPTGADHSWRLFAHRQRFSLSRTPLPGQSSRPATSLLEPIASYARSAFRSAAQIGLPRFRLLHDVGPLRFPQPVQLVASTAPTPLQGYYPPKDQSVRPASLKLARLPIAPDLRSLPTTVSITSSGCGSSFPVRYAFGGSLFLKPLGTFFTMLRKTFSVNLFRESADRFQQLLLRCVSNRLREENGGSPVY